MSATNAAVAGSTVTFFATGEGATNPPGLDGAVQTQPGRIPFLPVTVKIGGQTAQVVSAGTPVGRISGVMEVKAVVPAGLTAGPVAVVLSSGSVTTAQTVTIAL